MAEAEKPNVAKYRDRMDRAVSALKEEFGSLRTGRASVSLLDQVVVEAYGAKMPINQVGAVSVPEPRSITVSVWDKGLVVSVEKAIRNAGLGLNPVVEGQNLRVPIPALTEERRRTSPSWPANTPSSSGSPSATYAARRTTILRR